MLLLFVYLFWAPIRKWRSKKSQRANDRGWLLCPLDFCLPISNYVGSRFSCFDIGVTTVTNKRARARSCAMRASVRGCVQVYVYILFVPLLPLCCVFVHWTNENFNTGRTFGPGENIDVVQPINTRCLSLNWLLWLWLLILYLWADGISLLRPAATCAQCEPSENEREREREQEKEPIKMKRNSLIR